MKLKKLVIIPIYNEVEHISGVIDCIRKYYQGDLLVINDGSSDGSAEIIKKIPDALLIEHKTNMGYGRSLINGFKYAIKEKYDLLITIDCDKQHEPCHIPGIFEGLNDVDIFSASRYLTESPEDNPPPPDRYRINKIITEKINRITNYNLTDGFCGLKGYRVDKLEQMDLTENGYAFPIEFWIQAFHFGLSVKEFSIRRIYKNLNRTFGGNLDIAEDRLKYYENVLESEVKRWQISLPLERTRTT